MLHSLRLLHKMLMLLLCGSVLVSCFDDTTPDYTVYNDLAVTAVQFGTMPRIINSTDKTGKDTLVEKSYDASKAHPFVIDQLNNRIYNLDSLPVGVLAEKIVFSAFTVSDGSVGIRKLDAKEDTIYSLTDTLDFSRGSREFNLYGTDGTSRRTYTVEVRIHKQEEDSLTWTRLPLSAWAESPILPATGESFTAQGGEQFRMADGSISLLGADGVWAEDSIVADEKTFLPTAHLTWVTRPSRIDRYMEEVLLYGSQIQADTLAGRLWRRYLDHSTASTYRGGWEYLPATVESLHPIEGLSDAALYVYDQGILLVGLDNNGEIHLKYTVDGGRTWKAHPILVLPAALRKLSVAHLVSAMDDHHNLWLRLDDRDVWCGRAHSVDWNTEETRFE